MKNCKPYTIIRYSYLTGKAVWICRELSGEGIRQAYYRACKYEIKRVHRWCERAKRRQRNILQFLSSCMDALPVMGEIAQSQRQAIRQIKMIAEAPYLCNREFIDHIYAVSRQRKKEHKMRQKMKSLSSSE